MNLVTRIVALCMSPALVLFQCQAQIAAVSPPDTQNAGKIAGLQVHVIGTVAELPAGTTATDGWAFQVTDQIGAVVPNALVTVGLPDTQPSGIFSDGKSTAAAFTDEIGRAQIPRVIWGKAPGSVTVRVTASRDGAHAGMLLEQKLTSLHDSGIKQATVRALDPPVVPIPQLPLSRLPSTTPNATPTLAERAINPPPSVGELARPGISIQQIGKGRSTDLAPSMSITTTGASSSGGHHSVKKWVVLAAVLGGGAAAAMLLVNHNGKSSSSSGAASNAPVTIGTPTITISH